MKSYSELEARNSGTRKTTMNDRRETPEGETNSLEEQQQLADDEKDKIRDEKKRDAEPKQKERKSSSLPEESK